jgi:hypothetical protein
MGHKHLRSSYSLFHDFHHTKSLEGGHHDIVTEIPRSETYSRRSFLRALHLDISIRFGVACIGNRNHAATLTGLLFSRGINFLNGQVRPLRKSNGNTTDSEHIRGGLGRVTNGSLRPPWTTRSVPGISEVLGVLGVLGVPGVPEALGVPETLGAPGAVLLLEADLGLRVGWPGSVKGLSGDLAKDLLK